MTIIDETTTPSTPLNLRKTAGKVSQLEIRRAKILNLATQGYSHTTIAKLMNCSASCVEKAVRSEQGQIHMKQTLNELEEELNTELSDLLVLSNNHLIRTLEHSTDVELKTKIAFKVLETATALTKMKTA